MAQKHETNSETLVFETQNFFFEVLEQNNGVATVVKFHLLNPDVKPGDVLLVLTGADVYFHGLIGRIDDSWAIATDHRSLLPVPIIN